MSTFVAKEPCPACGSRDNLARYSDGSGYCFGCKRYEHPSDDAPTHRRTQVAGAALLTDIEYVPLRHRGITLETCEKWGYGVATTPYNTTYQVAQYRDSQGRVVGQKLRDAEKNFSVRGTISGHLYGAHLWRDGGRRIIVTEGEIDALTVSQIQDNKWPVVSVPNGASGAKKALAANLEWLNKFEVVVLCFDMDEPGRKAVDECVSLFPPGKVKVVNLPNAKDPNEMLIDGRVEELTRALWEAREYRPDGIVTVDDVIEEVLQPPTMDLPWCLPSLQAATYGRRYGELVALGAGTGVGKTTLFTQQLAQDLSAGHPVGVFAFEQKPSETLKRTAGQMVGKTFHVPASGWTQEELEKALWMPELKRCFLYNHFGACNWATVRERIRFLRHAHEVRIFYIDHLTALAAAEQDERVGLERIMAELGALVKELDIWILFVSHLATPDGAPHEEGGRVTIRHFKGSRAIGYWSHVMLGLERDQQSDEAEIRAQTTLRVLKERYTGQGTGLTVPLSYDPKTGLYSEAPKIMFPPVEEDGVPF